MSNRAIRYALIVLFFIGILSPATVSFADDMATIVAVKGLVSVKSKDESWVPATVQMALANGDMVKTEQDSACDIALDDSLLNIISLGANTEVTIGSYAAQVAIAQGSVFSLLDNLPEGSTFEVTTPQAIAGVRGTGWQSDVGKTTKFSVGEGEVNVSGLDKAGNVVGEEPAAQGKFVSVSEEGVLEQGDLTDEEKEQLREWILALREYKRRERCGEMINNYQGGSSRLFAQVLECDASYDETFASNDPRDIPNSPPAPGGSNEITGGDISNSSFTPPPQPRSPFANDPGNNNPPGCFLAGTMITMADGSEKPIENIQVGDIVLAYSEESDAMEPDAVTAVFSHPKEEAYLIINHELKVTPIHPVLSKGQWRSIGELQVGDTLTNSNGEDVVIVNIARVNESVDIYNFEVNPCHTYVANGFIVHNRKPQEEHPIQDPLPEKFQPPRKIE